MSSLWSICLRASLLRKRVKIVAWLLKHSNEPRSEMRQFASFESACCQVELYSGPSIKRSRVETNFPKERDLAEWSTREILCPECAKKHSANKPFPCVILDTWANKHTEKTTGSVLTRQSHLTAGPGNSWCIFMIGAWNAIRGPATLPHPLTEML